MGELNKLDYMECENKLLNSQQCNYKELCKILTNRHVEILKYLNHLKTYIEKVLSISNEHVMFTAYLNDKSIHELNIVKFDRQIQNLTEVIQSSQAQISDNSENQFKEQLKLLSTTLDLSTHSDTTNSCQLPQISSFTKYQCDQEDCSLEFTSLQLLEEHLRTHHNSFENFSHDDSRSTRWIYSSPMEILDILENSNSYPNSHLENSNIITNNDDIIIDNNSSANGTYSNKLAECDICGKSFNKHYIESHKRSHTGQKPYKCSVVGCNRTFTQTSSRNFHEKRFHRNERKYKCIKCTFATCELKFNSLEEMQEHFQQHHPHQNEVFIKDEYLPREQQPLKGVVASRAQIHSNPYHRKARASSGIPKDSGCLLKHVCKDCGKAFAYKIALKQHSLMHGEKNFRCSVENCTYASYWKHNLELHMKKHQNQKRQS